MLSSLVRVSNARATLTFCRTREHFAFLTPVYCVPLHCHLLCALWALWGPQRRTEIKLQLNVRVAEVCDRGSVQSTEILSYNNNKNRQQSRAQCGQWSTTSAACCTVLGDYYCSGYFLSWRFCVRIFVLGFAQNYAASFGEAEGLSDREVRWDRTIMSSWVRDRQRRGPLASIVLGFALVQCSRIILPMSRKTAKLMQKCKIQKA